MHAVMKCMLAGGAAALMGTAMAGSAEAYYMGYANGDPGNWGFYEEQHNGAAPPESAAVPYASAYRHPGRIEYHGRTYLRRDLDRVPSEH